MQPPPAAPNPTSFHNRAMAPISNPTYPYDQTADFKRTATPTHVLERPPAHHGGVDPRLTSQGSVPPVAGLPQYVPAAYQTPTNVWALYPQ
jgi:hypothetical protein